VEEILEQVSEHFETNAEALKERGTRNLLPRRCAKALWRDHAGFSHGQIAALFGMPTSNSVIRSPKRFDEQRLRTLEL
jgi:chromosomal replication initiation ATPase DnaA